MWVHFVLSAKRETQATDSNVAFTLQAGAAAQLAGRAPHRPADLGLGALTLTGESRVEGGRSFPC